MFLQGCPEVIVDLNAGHRGDIGVNGLPLNFMRRSDNRGLRNILMGDQRRLDFRCSQAMTGNIDDIIQAAHDPDVAVLVLSGAVFRVVDSRQAGKVCLFKPFRVTIHATQYAGPWFSDNQSATLVGTCLSAVFTEHGSVNAGQRPGGGPGF